MGMCDIGARAIFFNNFVDFYSNLFDSINMNRHFYYLLFNIFNSFGYLNVMVHNRLNLYYLRLMNYEWVSEINFFNNSILNFLNDWLFNKFLHKLDNFMNNRNLNNSIYLFRNLFNNFNNLVNNFFNFLYSFLNKDLSASIFGESFTLTDLLNFSRALPSSVLSIGFNK